MTNLKTIIEKRLHELYDFENMPLAMKSPNAPKMYSVEADERSATFLNDFFNIDYQKIDQLKNLNRVLKSATSGYLDVRPDRIGIVFKPDRVGFFFDEKFRFAISEDQTIDDLKIEIFGCNVSFEEFQNGSAYEKSYENMLLELNQKIPQDLTLSTYFENLSDDINNIIRSKISDDSVIYFDSEFFKNNYASPSTLEENIPSLNFKLTPNDIRKSLHPFFSEDKIDNIVILLSSVAFYIILDNPSIDFKILEVSFSVPVNVNKFEKDYNCYKISVHADNYKHVNEFFISTNDYFISYREIDPYTSVNQVIDIPPVFGFNDVHQSIKNDIAAIFKKHLDIDYTEITVKDFEMITMVTF